MHRPLAHPLLGERENSVLVQMSAFGGEPEIIGSIRALLLLTLSDH